MILRGMAQMHIDDLPARFQALLHDLSGLEPQGFVWVVFYQGRIFGAYPDADLALRKVTEIEHCISEDEVPTAQV
ncbi:hypothetical protein N7414_05910 [Pseudomonas sp. GD04087]|uniref:hypothetical protein n=1 Tax=unclassified Pseudomonas TaxID=196821 RepID=UPI00188B3725|nr:MULTISPECIES: hypothetical protein [unclassified Pseudomonas]MBF3104863.1 hypothetical protein [Pseudomonas aeruginosa]MDH0288642.1 hypothetical protein [Pseudomonas sp. GD04087]MDH1049855.1 hypothetical protein [Pseudomonas sp. GD03903]MDH1998122.1 hypothetical protein [Pseudomonas sp. GD03691]